MHVSLREGVGMEPISVAAGILNYIGSLRLPVAMGGDYRIAVTTVSAYTSTVASRVNLSSWEEGAHLRQAVQSS